MAEGAGSGARSGGTGFLNNLCACAGGGCGVRRRAVTSWRGRQPRRLNKNGARQPPHLLPSHHTTGAALNNPECTKCVAGAVAAGGRGERRQHCARGGGETSVRIALAGVAAAAADRRLLC